MSIEKLRADTCDFDDEDCKKCQQAKILQALLDEHEKHERNVTICAPWVKAQELIDKYGEAP